jgi:Aspartyl/Asparaginyl beta-hydroxylase
VKVAAKLPLSFDPADLQADLARIDPGEWLTHFNTNYFEGAWTGVALRAALGNAQTLYADPAAQKYSNTAVMLRCPHIATAIGMLQCPLKSVRLLKLAAGSHIREHRDDDLGWEAGEVRLHVPIITNPEVEFYLKEQRVVMQEGECWYLDLSRPHRVQNRSKVDRIHLVIDCLLNDWLRAIIEAGQEMAATPGVESEFERFRRLVLGDPSLQGELMQVTDRNEFTSLALQLGAQHGARFTAGDVDAAFQAARRAWIERAI